MELLPQAAGFRQIEIDPHVHRAEEPDTQKEIGLVDLAREDASARRNYREVRPLSLDKDPGVRRRHG